MAPILTRAYARAPGYCEESLSVAPARLANDRSDWRRGERPAIERRAAPPTAVEDRREMHRLPSARVRDDNPRPSRDPTGVRGRARHQA